MSRMSNELKEARKQELLAADSSAVRNFMGGISYKLNPLDTLRMIAASSIFGEASYYRKGKPEPKRRINEFEQDTIGSTMLFRDLVENRSTTEVFEKAIDDALSYDFLATLDLAVELRTKYNMRLNPQVIMVRAAIHQKRKEFTAVYPGKFDIFESKVMLRGDEPAMQIAYFIWLKKSKNKMPSILKRAIANKLSALDSYQIAKYKNAEIGMINAVRIVHANSAEIDELMRTGTIQITEDEKTWENLISAGMSWNEFASRFADGQLRMPAFALLRNLRNLMGALDATRDSGIIRFILDRLKADVPKGKMFPFRYKSAYDVISKSDIDVKIKQKVLDALSECMDISVQNMGQLKGYTIALTDNSGSAWGQLTTEYGSTKVANIDNLSSVIAVRASEDGHVVKFGDRAIEFPVSRKDSILSITEKIDERESSDVGGRTEGGIWEYLQKAIQEKIWIDNLFIFSDQQAGTGMLYGTPEHMEQYIKLGYSVGRNVGSMWSSRRMSFIDVYALINAYRAQVNPKVNVFSVQTAGYDNVVIPAMSYRCAMLTGWTGKEVQFAQEYIQQWDNIESRYQHR